MVSCLAAGVISAAIESVRPQVFLLVSVLIGFGSMRFGSGRFRFSSISVRFGSLLIGLLFGRRCSCLAAGAFFRPHVVSLLAAGAFLSVRRYFLLVSVRIGFGSMRFGSGRFQFSSISQQKKQKTQTRDRKDP